MSTKPLTREDILGADDIKIEKVLTPDWGGHTHVKSMTGTERDRFEASLAQQRGKSAKINMANIRAKLAAETICNEDGSKLFTVKDVIELGKKSASMLQIVFDAAQRLSGITEEDVEELAAEMDENFSEGSASD